MLQVKDVKKYYRLNNNVVKAVDGITYAFEPGKFYAIVGRSGSGKSTFLGLLGSLLTADEGEILLSNQNVTRLSEKQKAKFRNARIGFVFQNFCLESQFTCFENVTLPMIPSKIGKKERNIKALDVLRQVGLEERYRHKVCELSGGEKQRTAIARALVNDPDIILADEPTGNLDSENGHHIIEILKRIAKQGKTVIMVTHNMEDAAEADAILYFKDGKLMEGKENA